MVKGNTRKSIIILLLILTLALSGVAIYVGIRLSQKDEGITQILASSGETCCDNQCSNSSVCWCVHLSGVGANKCTPTINADEWICGSGTYDGQVCYTCPSVDEVEESLRGSTQCNSASADDCSSGKTSCSSGGPPLFICGNGNLETGEECEQNSDCTAGTGGTCSSCTCSYTPTATCGNGTVESGEACESNSDCITQANGTCTSCACSYPIITPTCGNGTVESGEECEANSDCEANQTCTSCACTNIVTPTAVSCESITGDVATVGPSEVGIFRLVIDRGNQALPASSSVRLRVTSTTDTTNVGRDGYHTPSTAIVTPVNEQATVFDQTEPTLVEFQFIWEAVNTDNSSLTNGTYEVEVSIDGGTTWQSISTCGLTLTYSSTDTVQPNFLILKRGVQASCSTSAGARLNYTITVRNLGPVQGSITYVEEKLDPQISSSWVSNITSSLGVSGVISGNTITWTGTETQRAYAVDEVNTFTYTITIPASSLSNFSDGIPDTATVVFNPDQNRYSLVTSLSCSSMGLPSTGFISATPWIFATLLMLIGLVVLRMNYGMNAVGYMINQINNGALRTMDNLGMNGIEHAKRKKKFEDRFKQEHKSKQ